MPTRSVRKRVTRKTKQRNSTSLPPPQSKPPSPPPTAKESTPPQTSGSELNNVSGGSPSSVESPACSRKKPRMEEKYIPATTTGSTAPESEPEGDEKRVMFLSQYLCISLWRALQSCDIWDSRLITAFAKGPQTFTQGVTQLAKTVHRKLEDIQPEALVESYLSKLRPSGLYSSCAKILQKTKLPTIVKSLKRKKEEEEEVKEEKQEEDDDDLLAVNDGQYKYRFVMDEPRLIVINGPQKDDEF